MKQRSSFGWLELVLGVLLVVLGILTLVNPSRMLSGLVALFAIVTIISGVVQIVYYVRLGRRTGFGPTSALVGGILCVVLGALFLFNLGVATFMFGVFFGLWLLFMCISRLANLPAIRYAGSKALYYGVLIFSVLGIALSIILIVNPSFSIATMGWLVGLYLIIWGVVSLAVGASEVGGR